MIRVCYTDISELGQGSYEKLYEKASSDRKKRADRYRDPQDALRCVTAYALLLAALGQQEISEEKTPEGKPYIPEYPNFHYNLSHSGNWVVLAWGDREVGVDVEQIRPDTNTAMISGRFFSEKEQLYLSDSQEESRGRFFEIWTAKESYVKYRGTGLRDIASCDVFSPEEGVRFYHKALTGSCILCLCTRDTDIRWEQLDPRKLL